jgi:UDP-N-acetylmuramate dehydrogenase
VRVEANASLKRLNTFGVAAQAAFLVEITSTDDLEELVESPALRGLPRLVVAGGSNLLFTGDFAGVVVHPTLRGIDYLGHDDEAHYVRAAAAEPWHNLVQWTLGRGYDGLENLSLIPGSAGAAPIQNIGAYGVELGQRFESLTAASLTTGKSTAYDRHACRFDYRCSRFKDQPAGETLITGMTIKLPRRWEPVLHYPGIRETLERLYPDQNSAIAIGAAVCALRRDKLPDPNSIGNAGSFFKNPVISAPAYNVLKDRMGATVHPQADGRYKVSAAALIDACGWKGHREGDAGVSDRHALILVNHGAASGAQIWALAQRIQDSVEAKFGLRLEPEPVVV